MNTSELAERHQREAQRRRRLEKAKKKSKRLLSRKEVLERVPLSYPTIWEKMQKGEFPRAHELGNQKVAWYEWEIDDYIDNLPIKKLKGDDALEVT